MSTLPRQPAFDTSTAGGLRDKAPAEEKLSGRVVIHVRNNVSSTDLSLILHIVKQRAEPVAWLLISVLAVVPVGGHVIDGILLCIEGDGHVEVESSAGLRCNTFLDPQNHPVESESLMVDTLSGGGDHCGSCLDILFPRPGDQDCGAVRAKPVVYPQLVGFTSNGGYQAPLFRATARTAPRNPSSQTSVADRTEPGTVVLLI